MSDSLEVPNAYLITMLVVLIIQLIALIANLIGIFVLIALIKSKGSPDWKPANDIYRSLLTLFAFVSILKIFGFIWKISLVWKLKRSNDQKDEMGNSGDLKNSNFSNNAYFSNENKSNIFVDF